MTIEPPPKRKSTKRPTARSMELLRSEGREVDVVERWLRIPSMPGGGLRKDLFGGIDLLVLMDGAIAGIQCGSNNGGGHSQHKKKLLAEPRMLAWLNCGGKLFIHSWAKQGPAGKAKRWQCRIEELTIRDFTGDPELSLFT